MNAAEIIAQAEAARDAFLEQVADLFADKAKGARYAAVVRSVKLEAGDDARTIVATVPQTRDGRVWAYVAGEVLDVELPDDMFRRAEIVKIDDWTYQLTW